MDGAVLFAAAGLIDTDVLLLVLVGAAGLPLGWSVGVLVFDRLSPRQFRSGMLAMLVLSAVAALASAT